MIVVPPPKPTNPPLPRSLSKFDSLTYAHKNGNCAYILNNAEKVLSIRQDKKDSIYYFLAICELKRDKCRKAYDMYSNIDEEVLKNDFLAICNNCLFREGKRYFEQSGENNRTHLNNANSFFKEALKHEQSKEDSICFYLTQSYLNLGIIKSAEEYFNKIKNSTLKDDLRQKYREGIREFKN